MDEEPMQENQETPNTLRIIDLESKIELPQHYEKKIEVIEDGIIFAYEGTIRAIEFNGFSINCRQVSITKYELVVETRGFFGRKAEPDVKKKVHWQFSHANGDFLPILLSSKGEISHDYRTRIGERAAKERIILSKRLFDELFIPLEKQIIDTYSRMKSNFA